MSVAPQWPLILRAIVATLEGDAQLTALVGEHGVFHMTQGVERRVPGIGYQLIYEGRGDVMDPVIVQIDHWARATQQKTALEVSAEIEARVMALLHSEARRDFGGWDMATLFVESRDMDDPKPGVVRRQMDFRFEPLRRRTHA